MEMMGPFKVTNHSNQWSLVLFSLEMGNVESQVHWDERGRPSSSFAFNLGNVQIRRRGRVFIMTFHRKIGVEESGDINAYAYHLCHRVRD